jgi:Ca-activated chloride channel family protein
MPVDTETCGFVALDTESGKPIQLAMQQLWLQGKILPVGARLMVRHVFRSGESRPMDVIYAFALPRDATMRQFIVTGEGFRVRSRLKPTEEAVKEYEAGIQEGRLATLARQYGDGLVNLTVGNIRPNETVVVLLEVLAGVEAHDNGLRFRFPFTLAPSYHRRARTMEVEPGVGEIELPEEEFDDLILPRYQKDATDLHEVGFSLSIAMAQPIAEVSSPSHAVRVKVGAEQCTRVTHAAGREVPDRDLVLDVATREARTCILAGPGKDGKRRFVALLPSRAFGETSAAPRHVVFVLDRSGSMGGVPIEQAKKALEACLGALAADDEFGIIAFDDKVERFDSEMRKGDRHNRDRARKFLASIDARGGTELAQAVAAAVKLLEHAAGDILVMTDGQVFGTEQILGGARAGGVRLHCLGIGTASQDRFLTLLARETGGVCRFLSPRERVDLPAVELFASLGRPLASGLKARVEGAGGGHIAPDPPSAVFTGAPFMLFGHTEQPGQSKLLIEWEKPQPGKLEIPLDVTDSKLGETLRLLQGSRLITDLDSRYLGERADRTLDRREQKRIGDQLQALSEAYGLASRRMSLVAVVERAGDQPGELPKTTVVPVGMPQDVLFGAYFPGLSGSPNASGAFVVRAAMAPMASSGWRGGAALRVSAARPRAHEAAPILSRISGSVRALFQRGKPEEGGILEETSLAPEDMLLDLARQLEPDGGMAGKNDFERVVRSLVAVLAFLIEGHTTAAGAFRTHVQRLMHFLETSAFPSLDTQQRRTLDDTLAWIKKGIAPPWKLGDLLACEEKEAWGRITRLVTPPH